jgi:hypothetical protein
MIKAMDGATKVLFLVMPDVSPFVTAYTPPMGPTKPPVRWLSFAFNPKIGRLGRESDHLAVCSVEVKNVWRCIVAPSLRLHNVVSGCVDRRSTAHCYCPL